MLDGKMLRGETGMPMRRKLFANSSFADAEPEPLTLANLTTKSFSASMRCIVLVLVGSVLLVDLAQDGLELEHAEVGLVGEELLAHLERGLAHRRRGQAQVRALRGELDLAGAVQAPEADEGLGNRAANGQQAVVAEDQCLI